MDPNGDVFTRNAWPIVLGVSALGAVLMLLGAGMLTGSSIGGASSIGAFAFIFAGMVIMWKSEHLHR